MKTRNLTSPALTLLFTALLASLPAAAQVSPGAGKPNAEAKTAPAAQAAAKFSDEGKSALRDIEAARLAIFSGDPKLAIEMITKAKTGVAKAELEAPSFMIKPSAMGVGGAPTAKPETTKAEMVPVDGQLVLADDFVATPEKQTHIANANEHFKNGKHEEALKELRLADVEVMYDRLWLPLASTYKRLDQASKLMDEHKYYEANLALKGIGDSLTIETIVLTGAPKKAEAAKKTNE